MELGSLKGKRQRRAGTRQATLCHPSRTRHSRQARQIKRRFADATDRPILLLNLSLKNCPWNLTTPPVDWDGPSSS